MFALVTCKIGMEKHSFPKLLEKEKLQMYGTDKIVHEYCYIKLYSINAFSASKSLIGMISLTKASCALLLYIYILLHHCPEVFRKRNLQYVVCCRLG